MYLIKFIAYNKFINFYHSVYQYSLFMCYYIQIYMYVIHWLCIEAPPWQEFGYIDSLIYTLAAHHTLFTVCTSSFFLSQVPDSEFNINFFFTYLYSMLLTQCGIIRDCAWYCINYTVCHVNITYCGLALESMRITVNKVLNCILNSQGKFVYPFDLTMNIERYQ